MELLTPEQLMERLHIKKPAYKNLIRKGCPYIKVHDNLILFNFDEVVNFLHNRMQAPNSEELQSLKAEGYVATYNGRNYITDKGTKKLLSK